jgi:hypothetical protein
MKKQMHVMKSLLLLSVTLLLWSACGNKTSNENSNSAESAVATPNPEAAAASKQGGNESEEASAHGGAWVNRFSGTMDGKIEVVMTLHGLGDIVRGTITYKKSGKPIIVLGTWNEDGTFFLREYQPDGSVSGILSGNAGDGKMVGTWSSPTSEKELKLALNQEGDVAADTKWPFEAKNIGGEYSYSYGEDGGAGSLSASVVGQKVKFSINCVTGAPAFRIADVEESEGELVNNEVRYKMPDFDCEFVIQFFDGFAAISHIDEKYDCGFGMGAGIEGMYLKK